MVHVLNRIGLAVAIAVGLAACGRDEARDQGALDAAVVDSIPLPADIDTFDTSNCDPVALQQPVEATPANIASALDPYCFNSGEGRRALVIDALCARDDACGVRHSNDCSTEYEERWQDGLRPRGRSVPCADALLDFLSCLAQASCNSAHVCDAWRDRADIACDPNQALGVTACPPLPEGREPTKGPLPDDAINAAGMVDRSRVPDFIPAWNERQDAIAGYVRYCELRSGGAVPVYADDLETVVGYMIPGRGFVPGPLPERPSAW